MYFRGPIVTVDKIDVLIDSKIELLSVIQVLSNYYINQDTITKGDKNYIQYLKKTFMDFSNDPFIIFFDKACEKEFSLSQPCCFFLTLDDSCEKIALRIPSELQWKFFLKAPVQHRFLSLLSDFIKNTNFLQFFSENYNSYTKILNDVIDVMGGDKYYPALEEYLGERFSFYKLIVAPVYGESYGPLLYNKSNEAIATCVLGINFYNTTSVDNRRRQQEYMTWHEFLHSFINPLSSAHHKEMNLPALKGGVSCKRCIIYEVRSVRKLFNRGVYYHFLLVLPILTALKGGVLDPTANKKIIKVFKKNS